MSIIFQLFCAEDLQKLNSVEDLEKLKDIIIKTLQEDETSKTTPQSPPTLCLKIERNTQLPDDAPPQVREALNKRFHQVSQQIKSTQPRQSFDFDRLMNIHFDQRDPEKEKKENMILEWAVTCEVNNFEFYNHLLRAKKEADKFFLEKTGQRPMGPDSLYSPFYREHPLYTLYYGLSNTGPAPSQDTTASSC